MKNAWIAAAAALAAATFLQGISGASGAGEKHLELIYGSDTRGYYRPCG